VEAALERDEFAQAAQAIHRFLWSEFCDWALEMEKRRLYEGSEDERHDAAHVLAWVLERTLRLLHPIMPFVTEEIWQRFGVGESIVVAEWPSGVAAHTDAGAERSFGLVQELVSSVRSFRSNHRIPPSAKVDAHAWIPGEELGCFEELDERIRRLALIESFTVASVEPTTAPPAARLELSRGSVSIPLTEALFDLDAEIARLRKALEDLDAQMERSRAKLANEGFVAKAAPDIVAAEREKLERFGQQRGETKAHLLELGVVEG
jgi:valyl-tRNA synthetase